MNQLFKYWHFACVFVLFGLKTTNESQPMNQLFKYWHFACVFVLFGLKTTNESQPMNQNNQ
jgi:hypothetical protein